MSSHRALFASVLLLGASASLVPSPRTGRTSRASPRLAATGSPAAAGLVGFEQFVRQNPRSDRFDVRGLDHLEFYCPDVQTASARFMFGLDMHAVGRFESDAHACSVVLQSGGVRLVFTAPAAQPPAASSAGARARAPVGFERAQALDFVRTHGTAVRAIGLEVADCALAFEACVANGGRPVRAPARVARAASGAEHAAGGGAVDFAEVEMYGNVVLRLLSAAPADEPPSAAATAAAASGVGGQAPSQALKLLPGYQPIEPGAADAGAGMVVPPLSRLDHVVGNVPDLSLAWRYLAQMTGFHPFAEFVSEDVGTVDSGLNSLVLASNCETVLFPINEPTYGTRRKSQIQTYLEQHGGPGVQHIALLTPDIFKTIRAMRARASKGGFGFMPKPSERYYRALPERLERLRGAAEDAAGTAAGARGGGGGGGAGGLTAAMLAEAEELGVLVDRDEQGVLLQIFTAPVSDRKTLFLELIQRVACDDGEGGLPRGGCGGFGKGNFAELFKSVEDFLGDDS
jgi:4-hydroxyphenylpyruvate dioxygenase